MNENKKNILPLVAVFIFTAAIASIIIWFVLNRNQPATVPLVLLPTQAPAQSTPTPAITVTPDFKSKIQVLNATDINGLAAAFKSQLVALGFSSVTPGNSKELAATNQVSFKASLGDISAFFNSKLGSRFEASYSADLQETAAYDIIFTLGTDIRTTPTTPPSGP
jgi:hypothetical protein